MRSLKLIYDPRFAMPREPTTAVLAATAAVAAASAAYGGIQQAQTQRWNAELQHENARIQQQQADVEAARQAESAQQRMARSRGTYIKSGIDTGVGSPVDVLGAEAADAHYDYLLTKYRGALGARDSYMRAAGARAAAQDSLIGGYMQAGTSLLSGASGVYARITSGAPSAGIAGGYAGSPLVP
ncbi:MAG: hypothetical protein AB7G15_19945 [Alphaproteobacteria bacterium]